MANEKEKFICGLEACPAEYTPHGHMSDEVRTRRDGNKLTISKEARLIAAFILSTEGYDGLTVEQRKSEEAASLGYLASAELDPNEAKIIQLSS